MADDLTAHDREVRDALAQILGEKRVRVTSRTQRVRSLIVYLLLIFVLAYLAQSQVRSDQDRDRFERASVTNCLANRENTQTFNAFIDKLLQTYATSPVLSKAEKANRARFFADAKQAVPSCPPLRGGPR